MRIAICIITCRRPVWLAGLLESLGQLVLVEGSAMVAIFVVDNDRCGSARETVAAAQSALRWPVSYEIEPRQGISFARNRAVGLALTWDAEYLACLDDDEIPSPHWLAELAAACQRYRADVVTGPVLPSYETGVAEWAIRGGFFERPRHPSGTSLDGARTGNCLIACSLVRGSPAPFDPTFALSGGEDAHFFKRVYQEGARIVWADEAIVYERVPPSRATARWLLQRAYRGGTTFAHCERLLRTSPGWPLARVCTSAGRGLQGLLLLLPSLFLGRARIVRALQMACVGAGILAGTLGLSYREYKVIHGE